MRRKNAQLFVNENQNLRHIDMAKGIAKCKRQMHV